MNLIRKQRKKWKKNGNLILLEFPNQTCVLTMQNNQNRNKRHFQSHHIWVMWIFIEIIFIHYIFNEIAVDDNVLKIRQQQCNFYRWIEAFRTHSHLIAQTNPIELKKNTRYSYNHLFSFSFFFSNILFRFSIVGSLPLPLQFLYM